MNGFAYALGQLLGWVLVLSVPVVPVILAAAWGRRTPTPEVRTPMPVAPILFDEKRGQFI